MMFIAQKGSAQYYINDDMVKPCAAAGYKILKEVQIEITDIDEELSHIEKRDKISRGEANFCG